MLFNDRNDCLPDRSLFADKFRKIGGIPATLCERGSRIQMNN